MKTFVALLACIVGVSVQAEKSLFYVGSRITQPIDPITLFSIDSETGVLEKLKSFGGVASADYIGISKNKDFLYSVDTATVDEAGQFESVASYRLDKASGDIELINKQPSLGNGSCYLSATPDNEFLLVANYITGNLVVLPISAEGSLKPVVSVVQNEGSGPNKARQEKAHSHYIHVAQNANYVLSADLGTDKVMNYVLTEDGELQPNPKQSFIKMPAGGGPRHMAFHDDGKHVYILNELTSSVSAATIEAETGVVDILETHSVLPSDYRDFNKSAAIRIHPNGQYLYVSNRGHNSMTVFEILDDGNLKRIQIKTEGVGWVRDFNFEPSGKYLVAGTMPKNELRVFELVHGKLHNTAISAEVDTPAVITFIN